MIDLNMERRGSKLVKDPEVKIMSTKFQQLEDQKKKKKRSKPEDVMKEEALKKRQELEEMMLKTLKKSQKKDDPGKDKTKSYIVTETGLVEDTGERGDRRNSVRNTKTLLSFIGVEDAKKKLKNLAEKRRATLAAEELKPVFDKLKPTAAAVENKTDTTEEADKRHKSLAKITGVFDAKRRFSLGKKEDEKDMFETAIQNAAGGVKKEVNGNVLDIFYSL